MDANKICPGVVQRYVCGMDVSFRQKPQTEVREETYDQTTKKLQFDFTNATYRLCLRGYLGLPEQTPFSLLCDITISQKAKKKKTTTTTTTSKLEVPIRNLLLLDKKSGKSSPFFELLESDLKRGESMTPYPTR